MGTSVVLGLFPEGSAMKYFAEFRFDEQHGLLWHHGVRVPLTGKAAAVLTSLIDAPEQRLTLNEILRQVWPDTHVTSGNIKVLVREIRQALADNVRAPRFVRTLPHGYEFIPRVADASHRLADRASAVFVGRTSQLAAVEQVLAAAHAGARGFVLVTGGPGSGKTAFSERALRIAARQGFTTISASCRRPSGVPEPLSPLLDAIHRLVADLPSVHDLMAVHAPALVQHLSEVGVQATRRSTLTSLPRIERELVAAVEELAKEAPVMLVLDDVQWLDQASVEVIDALARRQHDARLVVLTTTRPLTGATTTPPLGRLARELELTGASTTLQLEPLSEAEVDEYAGRRFDLQVGQAVGHLLFNASEGQPALLAASANALVRDGVIGSSDDGWAVIGGPTELAITVVNALEEVMERQLADLSREERRLLASVSALGLEFSARKAAAVTNLDAAAVEKILDRLARQGDIIARRQGLGQAGSAYQFTHAMYLEVLTSLASSPAIHH
jgi:predicted ATPase